MLVGTFHNFTCRKYNIQTSAILYSYINSKKKKKKESFTPSKCKLFITLYIILCVFVPNM